MGFEIAGYQVRNRIHQGRTSSVYRAFRATDGLAVVVKVPNSEFPGAAEIERLRSEHGVLSRIDHPRVVRSLGIEAHGNGVALVRAHVPGRSLRELLEDGPLRLPDFLVLARRMADAVAAVHDADVIHKDLNPSSFIVDPATLDVTLIDFDLASLIPREAGSVRSPGALEGTLAYMSPEQTGRMNRSVDYRTDFYSLGATFYEMLTGSPPFATDDAMRLVHQHIARKPTPLHALRTEIPPVVSAIVLRLLAKTAEERYQSAAGLAWDLERCRELLDETEKVEDFEIGEKDRSGRFRIPERLYGREREVRLLMAAYERAGQADSSSLMLVAGHPGVGKSRLVNEVQKPIVAASGYFVAGKFDQFKRNVPFASLHQALSELVRQVLTESEPRIQRYRRALEEALGPNGRLMLEVIPELERIIGPQPELPEVPPRESQNRFQRVFRNFIRVFGRPEHPLCIFLDDVQWVDSATLGWIEDTLTDREMGSLFLILAYRDNEVSPSHPMVVSLDRLRGRGASIESIHLEPLDEDVLGELVADTLEATRESVSELTRLVHGKTRGNPFFVNQLLESLNRDGTIRFSSPEGRWIYELDRVRAAGITDNVVEFMSGRLQELADDAQAILKLAACVGNHFDLATLAVVAEEPEERVAERLRQPMEQGLTVQVGQLSEEGRRYRFQHDRVQQAAYRLMGPDEAKVVRLRIGRLMLGSSPTPEEDDRLFDILQHMNFARDRVTRSADREALARLNRAAAVRARLSTAYGPALEHVRIGQELLEGLPERTDPALDFELVLERAECEHLAGDDEAAEQFFGEALRRARDDLERARVYERKIHFHTNQAQFRKAFDTGLEAARLFGIRLPGRFVPPILLLDWARARIGMRGRSAQELVDLPELTDERLALAMRFMGAVAKAAYQLRPEHCVSIAAKMVNLSLRHGNTADSTIGYLAFGVIFLGAVRGNHQAGHDFGQLVLSLLDRFENDRQRAEVTFVYGYFANSWTNGLADTEEYYRKAYQAGIDVGDFFHASCACSGIIQSMHMRGVPMAAVEEESDRFLEFLERVQSDENIGTLQAVRQTIRNLRGETAGPESYDDQGFDEASYVASLAGYGSPHFAHFYFVDKLQSLYLWGRYEAAEEVARASARYLKDSPGMQHAVEHWFYRGLLDAARHDAQGMPGRIRRRRGVRKIARRFRRWAERCPGSFRHKWLLLEAELARISGRPDEAARRYDEAMDAAEADGFIQNAALASELAGRMHLARGRTRTARYYLRTAAFGYQRWGATGLAEALTHRHRDILADTVLDAEAEPSTRTTTSLKTGAHASEALDLGTVVRASQVISGEVQLRSLLSRLLEIVVENAGAQRGVLLLNEEGSLVVQAETGAEGDAASVLQRVPLDEHDGVARSVVNYVARSEESVVLHDASSDGKFSGDPYVQRVRPRSVLCAPLLHQGKLLGVLYLENNLTEGAFTDDRVEILTLLSGQIGVSIANAELYERLEDKVRKRTSQLEARNRFIRQTFGRYLSDEIVDRLLETPEGANLGGEKRKVTILMADLRGFTAQAEDLAPDRVVALINIYLGAMTEVLAEHNGTIIDFIGDAILAVFGAPFSRDDDTERAVACAIAMQRAMDRVNERNREEGLPEVGMGVGLNTGVVVVGSIGSEKRAKYGVMGSHVNLASRVESYTVHGQILVSESTRRELGELLHVEGEMVVQPKGVHEPIRLYDVVGIGGAHASRLDRSRTELVELQEAVPFRYVPVDGKHVGADTRQGWLVRLSEAGAEIRADGSLEPFTDLRMSFESDETGEEGFHVYAKIPGGAKVDGDRVPVRFTAIPDRARSALRSYIDGSGGAQA